MPYGIALHSAKPQPPQLNANFTHMQGQLFNPDLLTDRVKRGTPQITNRCEARGLRLSRDDAVVALRNGAMTLPGSIVLYLTNYIDSCNTALKRVPSDWPMSHGELASADII